MVKMVAKSRAELETELERWKQKALAEHELVRRLQNRLSLAEARLIALGCTLTPMGHPESENRREP